ncbi:Outer membrane beta-barrel assembly protein BamC [hydrothermal vent metagenome]|uniref:Outer membrane beta-barrel assembly protein BamC n=1 Tax=hydrothermal vent metagenome TaxID=652676 RepID=A0A3B0W782_9ZZZZ
MHLSKKIIFISASFGMLSLTGCSIFDRSENNYRDSETEVVKALEMPPNLFNPSKSKNDLSMAIAQLEQDQDSLADQDSEKHIPTFKSDGLSIKSNLSERWLEIESDNSEQVWQNVKRFLHSFGFTIAEERKDIGFLKTEYLKRSELVPMNDVGLVTKLLNSWRPELADGVFDKFVVRIETDVNAGMTRVYFSHHLLYSPDVNEALDQGDRWKIKPYRPEMEAEALYQSMVFFGSSSEKALAQLKVTETKIELVDGEEFGHLVLRASLEKSWSYLQATVYRADWSIKEVRADRYTLWVNVPENIQQQDSFLSSLAFWRSSDKQNLPSTVTLSLRMDEEQSEKTILTVEAPEGETPLSSEQRRYIFENLGLLAQ